LDAAFDETARAERRALPWSPVVSFELEID
jgi:hypothetical protein